MLSRGLPQLDIPSLFQLSSQGCRTTCAYSSGLKSPRNCTTSGMISFDLRGGNVRRSFIGLYGTKMYHTYRTRTRQLRSEGDIQGERETHVLLSSNSRLIIQSCATTQRTFRPQPKLRRKSHSSSASLRGGVATQNVRIEGKA